MTLAPGFAGSFSVPDYSVATPSSLVAPTKTVMLVTRYYKEHVIYLDHSPLLLSLSRRAGITQESKQ
jgi:hypothetical protein